MAKIFNFQHVFEENLSINLDPERRSYLYVYKYFMHTCNAAWNFDVTEVKLGMYALYLWRASYVQYIRVCQKKVGSFHLKKVCTFRLQGSNFSLAEGLKKYFFFLNLLQVNSTNCLLAFFGPTANEKCELSFGALYVCVHVCVYMSVCVCVCMSEYVCICMRVCICMYACTHIRVLQPCRYLPGGTWDELNGNTLYQIEHNTWFHVLPVPGMRGYRVPPSTRYKGLLTTALVPGIRGY